MSSGDFSDWYKNIPQISRYWYSGSVIFPLAVRFGILNARNMVFVLDDLIYRFQVS